MSYPSRSAVLYGALLGGATISASVALWYLYSKWETRKDNDEGFSETGISEPLPKKVLVVGLDGAGKSCFLAAIANQNNPKTSESTSGFNVVNVKESNGNCLELWEIGGREDVRKYWPKFVEDTEILVFVVDAANKSRFSEAYTEMHKLVGDPRLTDKPFIVVANKQDLDKAANIEEVEEALGLVDIRDHKVKVVLTSFVERPCTGLDEVKSLLSSKWATRSVSRSS